MKAKKRRRAHLKQRTTRYMVGIDIDDADLMRVGQRRLAEELTRNMCVMVRRALLEGLWPAVLSIEDQVLVDDTRQDTPGETARLQGAALVVVDQRGYDAGVIRLFREAAASVLASNRLRARVVVQVQQVVNHVEIPADLIAQIGGLDESTTT